MDRAIEVLEEIKIKYTKRLQYYNRLTQYQSLCKYQLDRLQEAKERIGAIDTAIKCMKVK